MTRWRRLVRDYEERIRRVRSDDPYRSGKPAAPQNRPLNGVLKRTLEPVTSRFLRFRSRSLAPRNDGPFLAASRRLTLPSRHCASGQDHAHRPQRTPAPVPGDARHRHHAGLLACRDDAGLRGDCAGKMELGRDQHMAAAERAVVAERIGEMPAPFARSPPPPPRGPSSVPVRQCRSACARARGSSASHCRWWRAGRTTVR